MAEFRFTEYFEREVLRKRPYLRREWCIAVVSHPVRVERQENNRYRFWGVVPDLGGRYLRVVTSTIRSPSTTRFLIEDSAHEARLSR